MVFERICFSLDLGCTPWLHFQEGYYSGAVFFFKYNMLFSLQVLVNSKEPAVSMNSTRSTNILDNMNKSSRKSTPLNRAANNEKSPVIKPLIPKPKSKQVLLWWPCALCAGVDEVPGFISVWLGSMFSPGVAPESPF